MFFFSFIFRVSWGPRREETCPSPLIHSLRRRSAYSVHSHASHLRRSRLESQKNMPSRRSSKRKELKERYLTFNQPFIDLYFLASRLILFFGLCSDSSSHQSFYQSQINCQVPGVKDYHRNYLGHKIVISQCY